MRRGIMLGLLLALVLRQAGAWAWRRWRAFAPLPAELVRRSQ